MSMGASLFLYLLIGAGVAVAVGVSAAEQRFFRTASAVFFWPLFFPMLLSGAKAPPVSAPLADELGRSIAQADAELQAALDSLEGWAGHVLGREKHRIPELRTAWAMQAERIREMDHLLARPDAAFIVTGDLSERVLQLERARRMNRERLGELRRRAHDDLLGSLAWVRELASMIHLARFTGEPVARAEELVKRLAAALEDLSSRNCQ